MTKKLEKLGVETTEDPEPAEIGRQIRNLSDRLEATEQRLMYQSERDKEYQSRIAELNRKLESAKRAAAEAKLAFLRKQESRLRREMDRLEQSIIKATDNKDATKPMDSHPAKPKILQKALHPFILASKVYIPIFIYILSQTPSALGGMVDLTAGDYRYRLRLPVRNIDSYHNEYKNKYRKFNKKYNYLDGDDDAARVTNKLYNRLSESDPISDEIKIGIVSTKNECLANHMTTINKRIKEYKDGC
jgi:phage shock protein A